MAGFRAVVVGAGSISGAWFPPLIKEKVEVAAVVDLDLAAARRRVQEYELEAEVSGDLRKALRRARPDFVLDLTVPAAHCKVTSTALRAGCHVIGEKPMATSMAEARRMVRTAKATRKLYMVGQSRRWNPNHEALRRAAAGRLGRLSTLNCDFYLAPRFGGFRDRMASPLVLDMAIHHFDLARFFTGADPLAVYAREYNPAGSWYRGDASAVCIFEMTKGIVFTYRGSWCADGFPTAWNGDWRVIGERGSLLYEAEKAPRGEVLSGRKTRAIKIPVPRMKALGFHGGLREMLRFLRTGRRPQTECADNIKSLAMVFAAMESSRRGRRVRVRF